MCMDFDEVVEKLVETIRKAQLSLPDDVRAAIVRACAAESQKPAKMCLEAILRNIELAEHMGVPICQDTGLPIFFVELGRERVLEIDLERAIVEAVRQATLEAPLRPNTVHPLTRENAKDNTGTGMPEIKYHLTEEDTLRITYMPKGAGSENVSCATMLKPSEVGNVERFVVECVHKAGGLPCPPVIVGVGVGGSFDGCALLAKRALLEPIDTMNELEHSLYRKINALGIGAMGLGGDITTLGVKVMYAHCHTASLPVAVNIGCWANRRGTLEL